MKHALPIDLVRIEPLESRIAPATILTFQDIDLDEVKLISNKPLTASITFAANGNPGEILISGAGMDGADITTVVTPSSVGDGLVNIGRIVASGLDLGTVTVKGDLGKIVSGNASNPLPGLKALKVQSMGLFGTDTQPAGGDLVSLITGDIGSINVAGDAVGVRIITAEDIGTVKIGGDLRGTTASNTGRLDAASFKSITIGGSLVAGDGDESGKIVAVGHIGKLTIRGSMSGARDVTGDSTAGQIHAGAGIGPINIGRDIVGGISEEKAIDIIGDAGPITIGGSLLGNKGLNSAGIFVTGKTGPIKIRSKIQGDIGTASASIDIGGSVAGFTLGSDLIGGSGPYGTGLDLHQIRFVGGSTGPVKIGGDIVGNGGIGAGIVSIGGAPSFYLGGSIIGGGQENPSVFAFPAGIVSLGAVKKVTVVGDIIGSPFGGGQLVGSAVGTLLVKGSLIDSISYGTVSKGVPEIMLSSLTRGTIEGSVIGSPAADGNSFSVKISGNAGALIVLGTVRGGDGSNGGSLSIDGDAGVLKIGLLYGGTGIATGALLVGGRVGSLTIGAVDGATAGYVIPQIQAASFGSVFIRGDLAGGTDGEAGSLKATTGGIDSLTIGGSLRAAPQGGAVAARGAIGAVKIGGDIFGSAGPSEVSLRGDSAKSITVGGSLIENGGVDNALVAFEFGARKITIGGDIRGSHQNGARLLVGDHPSFNGLGFTSLTVKGSVINALIGGGVRAGAGLVADNGDAVLGPITVLHDFVASSIVASVNTGGDNDYATGDDFLTASAQPTPSRIASITIRGQIIGTLTNVDHYGFTAESIGAIKVGRVTYHAGAIPTQFDAIYGDFSVRLI
jgi:hypothetical protein